MLFAFVVLNLLVPSLLCQEIDWEKRLRNDLFLCQMGRKTLT